MSNSTDEKYPNRKIVRLKVRKQEKILSPDESEVTSKGQLLQFERRALKQSFVGSTSTSDYADVSAMLKECGERLHKLNTREEARLVLTALRHMTPDY